MPTSRMAKARTGNRSALSQLEAELVIANKVLVHYGVVDAFGHVSARHPEHPARFLMSKRKAPGLVEAADIREFGLDGELIDKTGETVFLERFIHSAIYAVRPDVNSVVHSHSSTIVAFSVTDQPLRNVCHVCGFLRSQEKGGVPVFEIRHCAGDATNLLISSQALGDALAQSLGAEAVVLMRGHGSTAVGPSVARAVYRAVYTEANARIQGAATALGKVTFLSEGEADAVEQIGELQVERTWEYWKMEVAEGHP